MDSPVAPVTGLIYGGPFSPALASLRARLSRETSTCWLLVALTTLVLFPVSWSLGTAFHLMPFLYTDIFSPTGSTSGAQSFGPLSFFASTLGSLATMFGFFLLPIAAIVSAVAINRRTYALTARDLVWGSVGLCLIDETFSQLVEEAAQQRYRPNPSPVRPGNSFADRLNHFAYYYRQYLRLSHGPDNLKVPLVIQGNCWVEGSGLGMSACLPCLGAIFVIPLALRAILLWPRIIAIKQAAIDFLAGKFDADIERAVSMPRR